jgi:four helix bundle protein
VEEGVYSLDDFELYNIARDFRKQMYTLIEKLPWHERHSLGIQMRRAVISVTNNIAEGHGRWHYQESIQFCRIARGSVEEVIDDLNICPDQSYGEAGQNEKLKAQAYALIAKINGYISFLRKCLQENRQ